VIDHGANVRGEYPILALDSAQLRELNVGRQFAVPEQVRHGLERLGRCELLHRIAAVEEAVRFRVDFRDRGVVDDDSGEALLDVWFSHALLSSDDPPLSRHTRIGSGS
jgi:hypothetical protein